MWESYISPSFIRFDRLLVRGNRISVAEDREFVQRITQCNCRYRTVEIIHTSYRLVTVETTSLHLTEVVAVVCVAADVLVNFVCFVGPSL